MSPRLPLLATLRSGDWLNARRATAYPRIFLLAWLIMAVTVLATAHGVFDRNGHVLGTDYLNVWAAGVMAHEGHAPQVYDYRAHGEVEHRVVGADHPSYYGWHYPPMFLLLALPFGLLPYLWSLAAYLAATLPAYWAVARATLPGRGGWVAALAFPGLWVNLLHGQNGFMTLGLLGGGLLLLERRPMVAGLLLGLLAYKPQFGLLIPLALAAGGHWRAFAAAALSSLGSAALSAAVFGLDTWAAFLHSLPLTRSYIIEQGSTGWPRIQSVFSMVRSLGGGIAAGYVAQGLALAGAATAVLLAWRRPLPLGLRAAVLAAAIPFTTPYLLDYDLVILGLPVALLAAEGLRTGFLPWEKTLLAATWVLPAVSRPVGLWLGDIQLAPVVLIPFLIALARRSTIAHTLGTKPHGAHVQI